MAHLQGVPVTAMAVQVATVTAMGVQATTVALHVGQGPVNLPDYLTRVLLTLLGIASIAVVANWWLGTGR